MNYLDLKALLDNLFEEHGSNPEALFKLYDALGIVSYR